jgi:large subunit ribosomal protein L7/L12
MIEKNPESVTGMSVETLEQKIAKQEEVLKQLKAQKQAVIAREKRNNLNRNEKMKLDVKFYSVL